MQEEVRRQLCEIVAHYGREVAEDPRRVRALLLDLCGEHRREVRVLTLAAEERVAAELSAPPPGVPPELLLARLARRLVDDCGLSEEVARWAVETWALALRVINVPLQPASTTPKPTPPVSKPALTPSAPKPIPPAPAYTVPPQAGRSAQDFEALVEIPVGPSMMGSDQPMDPDAFDSELIQHQVMLPRYWIGRAPVTVAQFRAFVQASDYEWKGAGEKQGGEDHPVVHVSWYDAQNYCNWLTRQVQAGNCVPQVWRNRRLEPLNLQPAGLMVRLPTEAEWEKAARGADGRIYPWGDEKPNDRLCNFRDSKVGTTTPVGKYSPRGDSPYGCVDMAGNVWEWTNSLWGTDWDKPKFKYPYTPTDGRENSQAAKAALRMVRGGSFFSLRNAVQCASRLRFDPDFRGGTLGFRVVVSVRWAVETWASGSIDASRKPAAEASGPMLRSPVPVPAKPRTASTDPNLALGLRTPPQPRRRMYEVSALIEIPAGPFLMGSDKSRDPQAHDRELPQHQVTLPRYWIGRAPVTVAQFLAFVQANGYEWEGAGEKQGERDHPVVYVSWYDARTYCQWLTERVRVEECSLQVWRNGRLEPLGLDPATLTVQLPTEAEWEKAARGIDGRIYPWGDNKPNDHLCNFNLNVKDTTPVGHYSPQGDSPYGCVDMAGNVWEWTSSLWGGERQKTVFKYPYSPTDGREDLGVSGLRVVRGGCWYFNQYSTRSSNRYNVAQHKHYDDFGFRCKVAASGP